MYGITDTHHRLRVVICALLLLVVGLIAPHAQANTSPPFDIQGRVEVTKVTDGDSLRSGPLRIRIFGIDAPETKQTCTAPDGAQWACGKAATQSMRDIVATAGHLNCHLRDTDRYGRLVMQCFAGEIDIAEALVKTGLAMAYRRYSTLYVATERAAQDAKRGMWAGTFAAPWEWRKAQ